jgi:hypothetical protein
MPSSPFTYENPLTPSLTPLEQAVMKNVLDGDHPILTALRKQLENATISSREFSGVGFFTRFSYPKTVQPLSLPVKNLEFGDVGAEIRGIQHGAGFLLFVRDGFLQTLEGYTYDEPWPKDTDTFKLKYHEPDRKKLFEYLDERSKG